MVRFNMREAKGYVCNDCGYFTEDKEEKRKHELMLSNPESISVGFIFKSTREDLANLLDNSISKEYLLKGHSSEGLLYQVVHHLNKPSQKDHSVVHGIFVYELKSTGLIMSHNKFHYENMEQAFYTNSFKFVTDVEMEEFRKNHPNLDDDEFKSDQLTTLYEKLEEKLVRRF